jgi:hypothetical protein
VQVAALGGAFVLRTARRTIDVAHARCQRVEDRIEAFDRSVRPADHHAIAAFEPPHAAGRADVDIVDALRAEFLRVADVVDIVRVPAVDDAVARLEQRGEVRNARIGHAGRYHQPHRARFVELADEIFQRGCTGRAFLAQPRDGLGAAVVHDARVSPAHQAPHHVRAHAAEADHPELH